MKTHIYFTFLLLFVFNIATSQSFNKAYFQADDANISSTSEAYSMLVNDDGSIVTIHNVQELPPGIIPNRHTALVFKTDSHGNVLWSRKIGVDGKDDKLNSICKTDDGGYLLAGMLNKKGGNRNWIVKLTATGSIMWERAYPNAGYDSESLIIKRTPESQETYFVVGRTFPGDRILAMKVAFDGSLLWSNRYELSPGTINQLEHWTPTSFVYDSNNNGYVIVGLERSNRVINSDLFSLGVDLNGNIYSNYTTYDIGFRQEETDPHIIESPEQNGFLVAFGTNPSYDLLGNRIAVMPLSTDLNAMWSLIYDVEGAGRNERANSIYADPLGGFALGCVGYDPTYIINGTDDRSIFLKIDMSFNPTIYHIYNPGVDADCTFMVQDLNDQSYILKSDIADVQNGRFGLIKTDLNGFSACSNNYVPDVLQLNVTVDREIFMQTDLGNQSIIISTPNIAIPVSQESCVELGSRSSNNTSESTSNFIDVTVYPNLVDESVDNITVEFDSQFSGTLDFKIADEMGRMIKADKINITKGMNQISLPSNQLSLGLNVISFRTNASEVITAKVIKL